MYITAGSHKSGSDDADSDVQIWRSEQVVTIHFRQRGVKPTVMSVSEPVVKIVYSSGLLFRLWPE